MAVMQLDLDLLRTFVTVHRCSSFTRASELLGRSQPAISLQMKRLEERVGAPILERDGRRLKLTPPGEILHDYARQILGLHDEVITRLTLPAIKGYVRLGILEELSARLLPKILASFARTFVDANLELRVKPSTELLVELSHGHLDFAFAIAEEGAADALPAWHEALTWIGAESGRIHKTRLGRIPLVALPEPSVHRQAALDSLARVGLQPEVVCTASTMIGVRAAVAAGIGIAAVGRGDLEIGLRAVTQLDDERLPHLPELQIALYRHAEQPVRLANHLIDHVRKGL
jgi:DNA-binding transcriptional LysR family regulator